MGTRFFISEKSQRLCLLYLLICTSCHFLFGSASENFAANHAFQTCIGLVIGAILGLAIAVSGIITVVLAPVFARLM